MIRQSKEWKETTLCKCWAPLVHASPVLAEQQTPVLSSSSRLLVPHSSLCSQTSLPEGQWLVGMIWSWTSRKNRRTNSLMKSDVHVVAPALYGYLFLLFVQVYQDLESCPDWCCSCCSYCPPATCCRWGNLSCVVSQQTTDSPFQCRSPLWPPSRSPQRHWRSCWRWTRSGRGHDLQQWTELCSWQWWVPQESSDWMSCQIWDLVRRVHCQESSGYEGSYLDCSFLGPLECSQCQ